MGILDIRSEVIVFANTKGGCGKSTLAANFYEWLTHTEAVALFDADPQGSILAWGGISRPAERIWDMSQFDCWVGDGISIIDTAGADSIETRRALVKSEVLIIPVQPSFFDASAIMDSVKILSHADGFAARKHVFVINRASTHPGDTSHLEMIDMLENVGLPNQYVCKNIIRSRKSYAESIVRGETVFESGDKKAIAEITAVFEEINAFILGDHEGQ